ncbi:MAG: hypothetical protein ACTSWY_05320 [Promethearchaeota archaeon]
MSRQPGNKDNYYSEERLKNNNKEFIEPVFSIDNDGRVICEKHTQITRIHALEHAIKQNPRYINQYEAMLTCKKCKHYFDDDCYFPRSEINKIETDRNSLILQCKLCGAKIDRPLTLMNKYYLESKQSKVNIEIPVFCCTCYASLNDNTFIQNSKKRIFFFLISLITSIMLFGYYLTLFLSNMLFILFFIPFIFWGFVSIRDIRNVYYLWKGRQYYDKIFGKSEENMEQQNIQKDRRELLDDEYY